MSNELVSATCATPKPTRKEKAITSAYIAKACQNYTASTCDLEIDDQPQVSIAKDGAWVAAWVWVPQEEGRLPKKGSARTAKT
jgi:hypothetical protein